MARSAGLCASVPGGARCASWRNSLGGTVDDKTFRIWHFTQVNHPAASCGALTAGRIALGAAAPKPPLAIPPPSLLGGILASRVKRQRRQ